MNAIILTAIWGIVMMFGGVFFKRKSTPRYWAIAGLILVFLSNGRSEERRVGKEC